MKTTKNIFESLLGNLGGGIRAEAEKFCRTHFDYRDPYEITDNNEVIFRGKELTLDERFTEEEIPVPIIRAEEIVIKKATNLRSLKNLPDSCSSLTIIESNIESLEGMPRVSKLRLQTCRKLKSLEGLRIENGGVISIEDCDGFKEIPELDGIPGKIYVFRCANIRHIENAKAYSIIINQCKRFEELKNDKASDALRELDISNCEKLSVVDVSVAARANVSFANNPILASVDIHSEDCGDVVISKNEALTHIGLPALVSGFLNINGNPKFEDLSNIEGVRVRGNAQISKNKKAFTRAELEKHFVFKKNVTL